MMKVPLGAFTFVLTSFLIVKMTKIVIIGLGAAGFGAVLAIKKQNRNSEVLVIDDKDFDLIHQCGLPFALEGKINFSNLKHSLNLSKIWVELLSNSTVNKIEFDEKIVCYAQNNNLKSVNYDKLIIAAGSKPFIPLLKTDNKTFTIHNLEDALRLKEEIATSKNKRVIIIGAGAIGLEVGIALNKIGLNVKVMDMMQSTFPKSIDADISQLLEEKLKQKGIELELGKKIEEIKEDAIVIIAAGVKPNIDFLEGLEQIKINKFGIEVNEKMEASIKDVYAAGDCCCIQSLINKEKMPSMLANNSYRQGVVA